MTNHVVAAQREEARDIAASTLAQVQGVTGGIGGLVVDATLDPADQLRRTMVALERMADAVAARIAQSDLVDAKGRPHGALSEWRKLADSIRATATGLGNLGKLGTNVNVGVAVVDVDGDRLAADLLSALAPWPDALNAARDVLVGYVEGAQR